MWRVLKTKLNWIVCICVDYAFKPAVLRFYVGALIVKLWVHCFYSDPQLQGYFLLLFREACLLAKETRYVMCKLLTTIFSRRVKSALLPWQHMQEVLIIVISVTMTTVVRVVLHSCHGKKSECNETKVPCRLLVYT